MDWHSSVSRPHAPGGDASLFGQAGGPLKLLRFFCRTANSTRSLLCALLATLPFSLAAHAQEPPYFVTYSHLLEEPGNLEIATKDTTAAPHDANAYFSPTMEFEYGATAWWTTEVYVQGQATEHDSSVFTGFRWENRFRVLQGDHFINPVLYVEYETVNHADKSILEVTGHDSIADLQITNAEGRPDIEHSLETKLILSSNAKGWNFSGSRRRIRSGCRRQSMQDR